MSENTFTNTASVTNREASPLSQKGEEREQMCSHFKAETVRVIHNNENITN
jgi:hypothetical protein